MDYRPEVHDSDGLSLVSDTGEWIWRPLTNPRRLLVTFREVEVRAGFEDIGAVHAVLGACAAEKLGERFDAEGISFAFPSQTVYLKQDSEWRLSGPEQDRAGILPAQNSGGVTEGKGEEGKG